MHALNGNIKIFNENYESFLNKDLTFIPFNDNIPESIQIKLFIIFAMVDGDERVIRAAFCNKFYSRYICLKAAPIMMLLKDSGIPVGEIICNDESRIILNKASQVFSSHEYLWKEAYFNNFDKDLKIMKESDINMLNYNAACHALEKLIMKYGFDKVNYKYARINHRYRFLHLTWLYSPLNNDFRLWSAKCLFYHLNSTQFEIPVKIKHSLKSLYYGLVQRNYVTDLHNEIKNKILGSYGLSNLRLSKLMRRKLTRDNDPEKYEKDFERRMEKLEEKFERRLAKNISESISSSEDFANNYNLIKFARRDVVVKKEAYFPEIPLKNEEYIEPIEELKAPVRKKIDFDMKYKQVPQVSTKVFKRCKVQTEKLYVYSDYKQKIVKMKCLNVIVPKEKSKGKDILIQPICESFMTEVRVERTKKLEIPGIKLRIREKQDLTNTPLSANEIRSWREKRKQSKIKQINEKPLSKTEEKNLAQLRGSDFFKDKVYLMDRMTRIEKSLISADFSIFKDCIAGKASKDIYDEVVERILTLIDELEERV